MANPSNPKMKILYLMRILLEKTDDQHPMGIAEIISDLAAYGIHAERKSIYSDIELLRHFGMDIEMQRGKKTGYYVAERQFELPELKLLVDAVQSCRIIPLKKSESLIKKLSSLTSNEQAKQLRRQVFIADRTKTINETVYYSIDQIHNAINTNNKISFKYFDYGVRKERMYRKEGGLYQATPITLCWNDDNYYLIAYSEKYHGLAPYRVDRMSHVTAMEERGDKYDRSRFNIADHVKRVFGMYEGENMRARLSFENHLVNVVMDHFGKDVTILSVEDGWFEISVNVSVSPVFLSWMFMFGDSAIIKEPARLIEAMGELIEKNRRNYDVL
ncbi:MAG: WYL domain-containing protein [Peptococcaceae bacterium]|nr:WYL domain-containing protein [Peptococcaceae bacterium]